MSEIIQFGPERRKTNQPARFGRGRKREPMTPNELAAWKLNQALEKYSEFTSGARQELQNEFTNMESLRTMNMDVLATTLAFLKAYGEITPNSFKDENILLYINRLLPIKEMTNNEKRKLITRFKAEILIYIRAIQTFRSRQ